MQDDFERIWKEAVRSQTYLFAGTEAIREIVSLDIRYFGRDSNRPLPQNTSLGSYSYSKIHISLEMCILDIYILRYPQAPCPAFDRNHEVIVKLAFIFEA
jgi:hypothetical protein